MSAGAVFATAAFVDGEWLRDARLAWDAQGRILTLEAGAIALAGDTRAGLLLPGVPNLHSHTFQRAILGRTERRGPDNDDFWTWREQMYRAALTLEPEDVEAVAYHCFVEMLEGGYTSVCEFHYLHLGRDGRAYADPAELSRRIASAAQRAGIHLCLLPVLYQYAGFDRQPPHAGQSRFILELDAYLRLVESLRAAGLSVGLAPHSLRAVDAGELQALAQWRAATDPNMPLHMHVSEQTGEVDECLRHTGVRPIERLMQLMPLDEAVCLVHATHASVAELQSIATRGATIALCPSTEGNLGDGIFRLPEALAAGVRYGLGSDSQVSRSPRTELRQLEYSQRLQLRQRCIAARPGRSSGEALFEAVTQAKRVVSGGQSAELRVGESADFLMLPESTLDESGGDPAIALDMWLFDESHPSAPDVYVGGRALVVGGRHAQRDQARAGYRAALASLR